MALCRSIDPGHEQAMVRFVEGLAKEYGLPPTHIGNMLPVAMGLAQLAMVPVDDRRTKITRSDKEELAAETWGAVWEQETSLVVALSAGAKITGREIPVHPLDLIKIRFAGVKVWQYAFQVMEAEGVMSPRAG